MTLTHRGRSIVSNLPAPLDLNSERWQFCCILFLIPILVYRRWSPNWIVLAHSRCVWVMHRNSGARSIEGLFDPIKNMSCLFADVRLGHVSSYVVVTFGRHITAHKCITLLLLLLCGAHISMRLAMRQSVISQLASLNISPPIGHQCLTNRALYHVNP